MVLTKVTISKMRVKIKEYWVSVVEMRFPTIGPVGPIKKL